MMPLIHFDVDFYSVSNALCYSAVIFKDCKTSVEAFFMFLVNFEHDLDVDTSDSC